MPETAKTELAWRLDSVGPHAASTEMCEATKSTPVTGPACSAVRPATGRATPAAGLLRRWNEVVRTWSRKRFNGLVSLSARFEEILHEFTGIIDTADGSSVVEAALLRQARRTVPGCRVELIMGPAPSHDQGPHVLAVDGGITSGMKPTSAGGDRRSQSVLEVPLRCGLAVLGRLRVRSRTKEIASLRKKTLRRLTLLCNIGACAIDRLDRQEEWLGDDDLAMLTDPAGADLTPNAALTRATFVTNTRLHDATFLNAVLPFALNQARRHNEPLSLVCVAIDRIGGIQELLGPGTTDRLVRSVADSVAGLIRTSDIVSRLDDDRVVAVLPRAPGGGALHVAQRICEAVAEKGRASGEIPNITVSIGVATFPACASNVFSLFDAADEALARAQSQGRNQACLAPRRSARASVRAQPANCQ
jgi:diguanylate cyclase (GGDEF)-like protein